MINPGLEEKIYPVVKIATVVDALVAQGVSHAEALSGIKLSKQDMISPATRVSLNQIIECYRNAIRLARHPHFAFLTGMRFHVSTYGMYGFAILSSRNFRQTMHFAVNYHQLATPLAEIFFKEENGYGAWTIVPVPHPRVDAPLYKFLVDLQLGIHISLHRDVMGPTFVAQKMQVTYAPPPDAKTYPEVFGCPVLFAQPENTLTFDASWLDGTAQLGNEVTYSEILQLCDEQLQDLQLRTGLAGKVREFLLVNLIRPTSFSAIAKHLQMTTRTLRRKLSEEGTSFRGLVTELRMFMAIRYLRDTELSVEDIAFSMGFSDAASFRYSFRKWTTVGPREFRSVSRGLTAV